MARPRKEGLDYFPLDTNFFDQMPVRKIKKGCGPASISVLIFLQCRIYANGYFIQWDDDTTFLTAETCGVTEGAVKEIINKALAVGYFDKDQYTANQILTSREIQEVFLEASKKRTAKNKIRPEHLIPETLDPDNISAAETKFFATETPENAPITQQSKANKTKNPSISPPMLAREPIDNAAFVAWFNANCTNLRPIVELDPRTRGRLQTLTARHSKAWVTDALKMANANSWVNGQSEKSEFCKPLSWIVANLEQIAAGEYTNKTDQQREEAAAKRQRQQDRDNLQKQIDALCDKCREDYLNEVGGWPNYNKAEFLRRQAAAMIAAGFVKSSLGHGYDKAGFRGVLPKYD